MKKITKSQIAEKLDRPKRTITFWADSGLIHPDDPQEPRAGRARQFSKRNLLEFAMVDVMTKLGVDIKTVKLIMETIQPDKGEIKDFFENPKWGQDQEYAYIQFTDLKKPRHKFEKITDDSQVLQFVGMNPENPKLTARIIWIGQIKQQALKSIGE